jgi:alpha-D-xyloside xylohydrolase
MDFNGDENVLNIADQWMFGPALMACPVGYYKARNRSVYFPEQCGWYDFYTGDFIEGGQRLIVDAPYERIPVFVREGSIIPFGPEIQYSDEKPAELINLYIYGGKDASFQLYEDEGTNYNYEKGKYATIDIRYDEATKTVTFGQRKGSFNGMLKNRRFNVVLISKDAPKSLNLDNPEGKMVQYSGKAVSVKL